MMARSRLLAAAISLALLGVPVAAASPAGATSGSAQRASISITVAKPLLVLGQRTRVSGVVKPRAGGVTVALQRKFSSGWGVLAAKKTNGQGEYGFKVKPTAAGIVNYRAVQLNRQGQVTLRSATLTVTTYIWHNVNDLNITESDNVNLFDDPAMIGGTSYPRSILLDSDDTAEEDDGPGFFVVDTKGRCAGFTAFVGALDDNTAGTMVRGKVTGDDEVLSDKTYAVGAFDTLVLDIRGFSEVRVDTVAVQQDVKRGLGVGTPMMLCAFPPLL